MDMVFPNPIDKRLDFVRKQYGQETYEKTRSIVAANLGIAEADIAPGQRVDWERFIPWLGKQVHRLLKKGPRAAPELKKLERGFLASVEPFMVKKKGRRADIARLSPKRARQFAGRQQKAVGEAKSEQAKRLGYKEVARLGNGYTAVVAVIDPKAPAFPSGAIGIHEMDWLRSAFGFKPKEWVAKYAPFQQWLGVELGNCLQFYKVNYAAHGESQFEIQRAGGKLYGILDPKGKPVAAILTGRDGSIRETNGPGNRPPPEKDQEYVDRFAQKHLKQDVKDTAFHPPEGFPPQIKGIIEYLLDYWFTDDARGRRRFLRKAQGYARQQGADFSEVWPRFAIYILEDSKYSALNSAVSESLPSSKWPPGGPIDEVIPAIHRVVQLYKRGGSRAQFLAAAEYGSDWVGPAGAVRNAAMAMAEEHPVMKGSGAANAMLYAASSGMHDLAAPDYTQKLLELMRDAARAAGGAQPRRGPGGNPTTARALIKECQRLWEYYCERPNKTRLKAVVKHCEAMKKSKATTVAQERRNCIRCVRVEARANKWEI